MFDHTYFEEDNLKVFLFLNKLQRYEQSLIVSDP